MSNLLYKHIFASVEPLWKPGYESVMLYWAWDRVRVLLL